MPRAGVACVLATTTINRQRAGEQENQSTVGILQGERIRNKNKMAALRIMTLQLSI